MPEEGRSYEGPSPDTIASLCHPLSILSSPKNPKINSSRPIIDAPFSATQANPRSQLSHSYQLSIDALGFRPVFLVGTIAQENESVEVTKNLFKLIFFIQLMRANTMPVAGGEKA